MFAFTTRYDNRIRTVDTPAEGGSEPEKPAEPEKPTERMYTQKELDGILARKLADKEAEAAKIKAANETAEELAKRKYEEGLAKGRIEAARQSIAAKYNIDQSLLPDSQEGLDKFKDSLDAYVTGHMKVVPSLNKNEPQLPSFVTGVSNG